MHVGILTDPPDFSAYIVEILKTWGLALGEFISPDALPTLDPATIPVLICPTDVPRSESESESASVIDYARRGGTVLTFLPQGRLARAAGLDSQGEKAGPLRLRVTAHPAAGLAGELLPIIGRAEICTPEPDVRVLAYLSHPGRFEGESAGITERTVGRGRIIAFAFDLPLCVLMLRQGDPARAEVILAGDTAARPSHIAAEIGPRDAGWAPFADLLGRLLVDTVRRHMSAPVPLLSHLPGNAPGILLYSGDEDEAEVAWNDKELDYVAAAGARMNLYIIPVRTNSTAADVARYLRRHDLGPHPDVRPLDGRPMSERLAEFERQIRLFEEMFGVRARTLRNHSTVWPGYMEPVEIMERLGVRMDGNFFSGAYKRDRESAPYGAFGGATPMRFCRPDGRLFNVFQQHTHLADDGMFGPADHSYKFSAEQYAVILDRIFGDIVTRFHTPYAVCIHPTNWVLFSRRQGQALLRQAAERRLPVWSFDQWSLFWDARDSWGFGDLTWDGARLQFTLQGSASHDGLCFMVPGSYAGAPLHEMRLDGEVTGWESMTRYREDVALVPIPAGKRNISASITYGRHA